MLAVTARKTVAWNDVVAAYSTFNSRLLKQALLHNGTAPVSVRRGGIIILDAIANANKSLDKKTQFKHFSRSAPKLPHYPPHRPSHPPARSIRRAIPESSTAPMLSKETNPKPAPTQQTYKRVVIILIALATSGLTYAALCFVGDYVVNHSQIFELSSSSRLHLYLYMFAFTPISAIVTTAIFIHTFSSRPRTISPTFSPSPLPSISPTRPTISSPLPRSPDVASINAPDFSDIGCETAMLASLEYAYEGETAGRMSFERSPRRGWRPSLVPGMKITL